MKVTIDRAKWNAGERLGRPALWRAHEYPSGQEHLCCLGFLGVACGVDSALLKEFQEPSEIESAPWPDALFESAPIARVPGWPKVIWESVFMTLNDFGDIDHATRESWISEGFRIVLGVECEFVGEYPEAKP